jgi:hypothetical protein
MKKQVHFFAQYYAEQVDPASNWAVISISDPTMRKEVKLNPNWRYKLELDFHDIDTEFKGFTLFNNDMAKQIIDFVKDMISKGIDVIVVHCWAGQSRSKAVAKFISDYFGYLTTYPIKWDEPYNKHVYEVLQATYNDGSLKRLYESLETKNK